MTNKAQSGTADPLLRIDSRQLRHLLAVVDCRGFTAAAERLNLTQPALSRSIQILEERLGVRLIERTPKSFQLTKFGHSVVDKARLIELEFGQILSDIQLLEDGHAGQVSIGAGPSSVAYLAPAIHAFQSQRPNITVRTIVGSMEEIHGALIDGNVDVICTALGFPKHRRIVTERLTTMRNVILARQGHPLLDNIDVEPERLLEFPWVFFANDRMGYERVAGYFAARQLEPPGVSIETNTIETMFTFAREGDYIASAPSLALPFAEKLGLEEVAVSGSFWSVDLGVAYMRSAHLPPAVASLVTALKKQLK